MASRLSSRPESAPPRKKSYIVHMIVGKQKQRHMKKVFWKDADTGALCPKDDCTWTEPKAFDGDAGRLQAEWLEGAKITLEEQGTIYTATVTKASTVNASGFFVEYCTNAATNKKTKKKARWVDLELPPAEKTSWWRIQDGYETTQEEDESDVSNAESDSECDGRNDMEVDDSEEDALDC